MMYCVEGVGKKTLIQYWIGGTKSLEADVNQI